jgi:Domain of unknown function (DUF4115)
VLIGGLVAVVVVLGILAAVLMARRSHDDEHSVEHYHRQLHTLEELRGQSTGTGESPNGSQEAPAPFPASAVRVAGSSTVRLTESGTPPVPPVPPPPVPNPSEPVTFDDASPDPVPGTFMSGNEDRVIHSINRRPRRLGGPIAAVAAVLVLVLVLILTGLHSDSGNHHGKTTSAATSKPSHPATSASTTGTGHHHHTTPTTTTSTTAAPSVSAPTAVSAHRATYTVAAPSYSLTISATTGECWVEVTNPSTGAVLFTTTLLSGQAHTMAATGPVMVIAGAPAVFTATVNNSPVTLPLGNQAPFTLNFLTAASATSSTTTTSTTSPS